MRLKVLIDDAQAVNPSVNVNAVNENNASLLLQ